MFLNDYLAIWETDSQWNFKLQKKQKVKIFIFQIRRNLKHTVKRLFYDIKLNANTLSLYRHCHFSFNELINDSVISYTISALVTWYANYCRNVYNGVPSGVVVLSYMTS